MNAKKKLLAPSILSADFTNLSQQIRYVELANADIIHCDIMDGHFVPNFTFGPMVVEAVNRITNLPLDVHLMIKNPDNLIDKFIDAGADFITVHQEEVVHLHRTIEYIKSKGAKAGVALNPSTPVDTLQEVLEYLDMVLIMSVNPGFGGQKFIERSIDKIAALDRIRNEKNYDFLIEVDGGIYNGNIERISKAGCNVFVAGSTIFCSDNITAAAVELKNLINK
ncbi:Ribulose-phosphate 3-epimerase [Melioribacter roseus P3M-2]|jgi:ribulose-phosphate 3-epimerase|uniref:Ribulose-phosphate 3-epimerase n=1 Tax=Melioribacter roseus (strain DSM 23840 / JCM 17771 / VKM B-2668 / P3M-2) TaxID=1191523 RepID=I7A767_MELRP|nr:ribulose-phosphate 3-epimerase [Melioribacter roseus]AFN75731.1 Ribulose-phosphate 3-epimerase [Melioribacter roseus P3M-2]